MENSQRTLSSIYFLLLILTVNFSLGLNSTESTNAQSSSDPSSTPSMETSTVANQTGTTASAATVNMTEASSTRTTNQITSNSQSTPTSISSTNRLTTTSSVSSTVTTTVSSSTYRPSSSGPGWWLFVALLITIVLVMICGAVLYRRQKSPYRSFINNWRSQDDDRDNIIQLEPTGNYNNQWSPRISFQ